MALSFHSLPPVRGLAALVLTLTLALTACGGGANETPADAGQSDVAVATSVPSIESHAAGLPADVDGDGQPVASLAS